MSQENLALISGILDRVIPDDLIAFGEVGLSGECRSVSITEQRIKEARRLGFNRIMLPARHTQKDGESELIGVKKLFDAIRTPNLFLPKEQENSEK